MKKIIEGVRQFQAQVHGEHQELFEKLAHGQQPETLFITCSDSRIDPNLVTQTKPGELFVVRNAGNIVAPYSASPSAETAAIEYAVNALKVQNIVICGHAKCGAMQGLLAVEQLDSLPSVKSWLGHAAAARTVVQEKYPDKSGDELLRVTICQNVLVQLDNLRTHPAVAAALATDRLQLHGWVYDFATGDVTAYDPQQGKFVSLS